LRGRRRRSARAARVAHALAARLPRAAARARATGRAREDPAARMKTSPVLVVSPAPEMAARVNTAVRGAGLVVQVEWASDAKDAAQQVERKHYDMMFCELPAVDPAA